MTGISWATWLGSAAAAHQHITGAHLGDEHWWASVAHPAVVARRFAVPHAAMVFLAGRWLG